ncbi:MAG: isochorismatase family cysteine hydrolase [Azospirillaceae bacterium]
MADKTVFDAVFTSFDFPIVPERSALLVIDMQYLDAHPDYGMGAEAKRTGVTEKYDYYFKQLREVTIPNNQRLLAACRQAGIECIFPRIGSLVKDCREVSLEHKRINLLAADGSREKDVLDEIAPLENEIVLSKGASGVFNATAIDQILRNLGIDTLLMTGVVTNYCVETAVRDAGDKGYNVVMVDDACAAMSEAHHRFACEILDGIYCKVKTTDEVLAELAKLSGPVAARA